MIGIKSIEIMVWGFFSFHTLSHQQQHKKNLILRNFEDGQVLESSSSIITKIKFETFQQFHTRTKSDGSSIFSHQYMSEGRSNISGVTYNT